MQKQTYDCAVQKTEIDGFIINDGVVTEYIGPTNVNSITIPLQARIISGNIFKKRFNNPIKVVVTENVKRIENNVEKLDLFKKKIPTLHVSPDCLQGQRKSET